MQHNFDVEIATEYGVNEAIILNNLYFWIAKNEANEQNFHDGYYWTYNSVKAFNKLFPYLSPKKIKNALNHLINEGILITGNYNEVTWDRTLWYALTEKGLALFQKGKCISPKGQMEDAKKENGLVQKGKPIPYINTDNKTDNKERVEKPDIEEVVQAYHDTCVSFPHLTKISDARKRAIKARLKKYGIDDLRKVFVKAEQSDFLKGNNDRGWKANFDWLLKETNMVKVLEGNYDNRQGKQQGNSYSQFQQCGYTDADIAELEKQLLCN